MRIEELEKRISLLEYAKSKYPVKQVGNGTYRIDPCPVCGHKDHFTIYEPTNSYFSFNGCVKGGGVYKFLQEVEGMNEEQAYAKLLELAGVKEDTQEFEDKDLKEIEELLKTYPATQEEFYEAFTKYNKRFEYFLKRAISPDTIFKYKLFVYEFNGVPYAVIPIFKKGKLIGAVRRLAIEDPDHPRYLNTRGTMHFWNEDYLEDPNPQDFIFVCEGVFDALTFEELGFKALSLNSVNNLEKFFEKAKHKNFITAFDNDKAGSEATQKAIEQGFYALPIPQEFKDVNEWYVKGKVREEFKQELLKLIEKATNPHSVFLYLKEDFINDLQRNEWSKIKTGFEKVDKHLQIQPALYVLGGLTSVGKTTFLNQLSDQIAEQEQLVIYLTMEQSKQELILKSLNRIRAKESKQPPQESLQSLLRRDPQQALKEISLLIAKYPQAKYLEIIEGNFGMTLEDLQELLRRKNKPVLVIDYLQVLQSKQTFYTDKQKIDYIITTLKKISRDFGIPIFAVSSFNRGSYLEPIDLDSFKESGSIEYTADVILGLQYKALQENQGNEKEKRELLKQAKGDPSEPNPRREVKLVCVKNRNGTTFEIDFEYLPAYDLLREV